MSIFYCDTHLFLKTALVMPFEPIGNKLRDEEKVLVLFTNLFVINIITNEALRQTDKARCQ